MYHIMIVKSTLRYLESWMDWSIHNEYIRITSFTILGDYETLTNRIHRYNIFYPIWILPDHIFKNMQVSYQISGCCSCITTYMQYLAIWRFTGITKIILVHEHITGWFIAEKIRLWINISGLYLDQDNISNFCVEAIWWILGKSALMLLGVRYHFIELFRWGLTEH